MATEIVVKSVEELAQAAKNMKGCADSYGETVRKMNGWVDQLSEAWEGQDQTAFVNQMKEFSQNLQAMAEKIRAASEILEKEKQNYMDHQNAVARAVSQLAH